MPDVHLKYLTLNNSACVEDAVGDDLDGALQKFGPDQLELIRVTKASCPLFLTCVTSLSNGFFRYSVILTPLVLEQSISY